MAESTPAPPSASSNPPDILLFLYRRRPLRVTRLPCGFWYGCCGLARALNWSDTASLIRRMGDGRKTRAIPWKGRSLMIVDHATMLEIAAQAGSARADPFLRWLDRVLRTGFGAEAPVIYVDNLLPRMAEA